VSAEVGGEAGAGDACEGTRQDDADTRDAEVPEAEAEAQADTVADVAAEAVTDVAPAVDLVAWPECAELQEGVNKGFPVNGEVRSLVLNLPAGVEGKEGWPLVVNWHGYGDSAPNMAKLLSGEVNNAAMPFILVTPEDTGVKFPNGLDWDIFLVKEDNKEIAFFDAILACVDARFGLDWSRVYVVGFSAGAVAADLMGVVRGNKIAGIVSFSGGYLSDPANGTPFTVWPEAAEGATYAQAILYGGTKDQWNAGIYKVEFAVWAANDTGYLTGLGHDLVVCDHGLGHTIPPGFRGKQVVAFFAAHPKGTAPSPYASGLPADFPAYCAFHPAGE
jgi:poly(3-hydroxybutyrate) depolymerase